MIRTLTRSGDLVRMRQGVYATRSAMAWAGTDRTRIHVLRVLAIRATVGNHAIASYQSAALIHHLDLLSEPPDGTVAVTVPPGKPWNRTPAAGIVFHSAVLPKEHLTKLYNLPVTTAARTVVDLARTLPFTDAVVVADSALREEKTTKHELRRILDVCSRWPGVRQARRVAEFADERAESPLESVARVIFDQAALEPPELQAAILGPSFAYRVDFLWREHRVIAEADGLAKYTNRTDMIRQHERDRLLHDAGYLVVHFTWAEVDKMPEVVIARIRGALTAGAPQASAPADATSARPSRV